MKNIRNELFYILLSVASCAITYAATEVRWDEADKYYGQTVTVTGKIVAAHNSGKACFLNFHQNWKKYFTAVIFTSDFYKFPANPEEYYLNREVKITGLVKEYQGKPEIILKDRFQIEITDPNLPPRNTLKEEKPKGVIFDQTTSTALTEQPKQVRGKMDFSDLTPSAANPNSPPHYSIKPPDGFVLDPVTDPNLPSPNEKLRYTVLDLEAQMQVLQNEVATLTNTVVALEARLSQLEKWAISTASKAQNAPRRLSQPTIEPEAVIESQIDGEFEGWEGETIFKLTNGQIWQQASYDYMYHYAYMPEVIIYTTSGGYKMKVEDVEETIEVVRIR